MEEHLISASEMAKKYDYLKVMAEKFYLEELQPKMLAVNFIYALIKLSEMLWEL